MIPPFDVQRIDHLVLRVRDLAGADVGTLNSWKLTFNGYSTVSPGTAIPDNNTTGISSAINVASNGTVKRVEVTVGITHTYIGDLIVTLVAPDGSTYVLHNRSGGSADNVTGTFSRNLSSEALNGTWKLRVNDNAGGDTGYINSWSITF